MLELIKVANVIKQYDLEGDLVKTEDYGFGNINKTIKLTSRDKTGKEHYFILQKINTKLFKRANKLMDNIEYISSHLRNKVMNIGGNPDREVLSILYTNSGKTYTIYAFEYYRIYKFITDSVCLQGTKDKEVFCEVGRAFGNFQNQLADFDANKLYEVLPNFHNTKRRYNSFVKAYIIDKYERASNCEELIKELLERKSYSEIIVNLLDNGELPLRVTHNDTKLNNVVLDKNTMKALAVLDLDTVMPATLCYDFGDAIRYGCNTASEEETDLSKVGFDLNLFEGFTRGYLEKVGNSITKCELDHLAISCLILCYELSLRFLTDYLNGDTYFGAKRETQNLDRAKVQYELLLDMERKYEQMQNIIKTLSTNLK